MTRPLPIAKSRRCRNQPAAGAGQSPRADHRRHRHRQDRHPATAGRAVRQHRRAGLHGRRQGRPLRSRRRRRQVRQAGQTAGHAQGHRLAAGRQSGGVLGCVRRERPPGARHGFRHGAVAARPPARAQRHPGRRAATGVQDRRRQRPAAARSQGSARHGAERRRQRQAVHDRVRQHLGGLHRRHPARPARPGAAGRRQVLRRAHARHRRPDAGRARPRRHQRAGRRQADEFAAALLHLPALAAGGTVRATARGRRPGQAEAGLLLRRSAPACSAKRRRPCWRRSSRWCA